MEGGGKGWEREVGDEEVSEALESCREIRWLAPDELSCKVNDRLRARTGLCGESGQSRASAPWVLALASISCSFLSVRAKDESLRRRDRRSKRSVAVAGWLPAG